MMKNLIDRRAVYHRVVDRNGRDDSWIMMVHGFTHNSHYFSVQVSDFQKDENGI